MTIWSMKASIPGRIREAATRDAARQAPASTEAAPSRPAAGRSPGSSGFRPAMLAAMTQPSDRPGRPHGLAITRQPRTERRIPSADAVILTGGALTVADVEAVARGGMPARLDVDARVRMDEARAVVERLVATGDVVYGITTGFGDLANTYIPPADARQLQENLLVSHAVGVGAPLPRDVVRAMLLLRANTFALGHSGCRPVLVDRLLAFLAAGVHPVVPAQGSVGASGDLAPLAHLALPLIGRGEVELGGQVMPALLALRETGIEPSRSRQRRASRSSTGPSS